MRRRPRYRDPRVSSDDITRNIFLAVVAVALAALACLTVLH